MTLVSDKFPILKCSELPDIIVEREAESPEFLECDTKHDEKETKQTYGTTLQMSQYFEMILRNKPLYVYIYISWLRTVFCMLLSIFGISSHFKR